MTRDSGPVEPEQPSGTAPGLDRGLELSRHAPCCLVRLNNGGWCTLDAGHDAAIPHEGPPSEKYPPPDFSARRNKKPAAAAQELPAPPPINSWWTDDTGRLLHVLVTENSPLDRDVQGLVSYVDVVGGVVGKAYACSLKVFGQVWRPYQRR